MDKTLEEMHRDVIPSVKAITSSNGVRTVDLLALMENNTLTTSYINIAFVKTSINNDLKDKILFNGKVSDNDLEEEKTRLEGISDIFFEYPVFFYFPGWNYLRIDIMIGPYNSDNLTHYDSELLEYQRSLVREWLQTEEFKNILILEAI